MRVTYKAFDSSGAKTSGTLTAQDEREALDMLSKQGLTPIEVTLGDSAAPWWQRDISFGGSSVNQTALQRFLFHLSCMLDAKLPLMEALSLLVTRIEDRKLQSTLSAAVNGVANGQTLSAALHEADPRFPAQVLSALELGELSDNLGGAARQVSEGIETELKMRKALVSAAAYPILLLAMAGAVLGIVLFYLLPILEPVFASVAGNGAGDPLAPLFLLRGIVVVLGQVLALTGIGLLIAYPLLRGRAVLGHMLDRLPVIGTFRRLSRSQRVAQTLANMLGSGGDLNTALNVAIRSMRTGPAQAQLRKVHARVQDGDSLSNALTAMPTLDPMVRQFAVLGENAERLPQLLKLAADLMEENTRTRIHRFLAILVPALTVTVGLVVGALVLITMNAVLSVNDIAL